MRLCEDLFSLKRVLEQFQFVLIVMPFAQRETYNVIKTVCCLEKRIPSQIILSKNILEQSRGSSSNIARNVAVQINCKLGGSPWGLFLPVVSFFTLILLVAISKLCYHFCRRKTLCSLESMCTTMSKSDFRQPLH